MRELKVNVSKGCQILLDKDIINYCGEYIKEVSNAKKICVISDTNVYPIYGEIVENSLIENGYEVCHYVFPAGESSKTPATVLSMVEFMAENSLTRNDAVVALGGGVCGDMAGFASSIYLRGIDVIQIPTSLLAQIDSSVGGKTAVDLPQGKNLCGAFHQPILVIIDSNVLNTLPSHYFSDGMGEAIKYGCIKSKSLFERIEKEDAKDFIDDLIYECVDIKRKVVENDEKEHGERTLLNFGHTCGHGIEKLHNFTTISHGEAIGIGMVLIAKAGEIQGLTDANVSNRIAKVLEKYNLKTQDENSIEDIIVAMGADKKRTGNGIKFVMIKNIGDSFVYPVEQQNIAGLFGV